MSSVHARPVIPHVFPEIHVHLGAAFTSVAAVEMTLPDYEIEVLHRLFQDWITVEDGHVVAPARPGSASSWTRTRWRAIASTTGSSRPRTSRRLPPHTRWIPSRFGAEPAVPVELTRTTVAPSETSRVSPSSRSSCPIRSDPSSAAAQARDDAVHERQSGHDVRVRREGDDRYMRPERRQDPCRAPRARVAADRLDARRGPTSTRRRHRPAPRRPSPEVVTLPWADRPRPAPRRRRRSARRPQRPPPDRRRSPSRR